MKTVFYGRGGAQGGRKGDFLAPLCHEQHYARERPMIEEMTESAPTLFFSKIKVPKWVSAC